MKWYMHLKSHFERLINQFVKFQLLFFIYTHMFEYHNNYQNWKLSLLLFNVDVTDAYMHSLFLLVCSNSFFINQMTTTALVLEMMTDCIIYFLFEHLNIHHNSVIVIFLADIFGVFWFFSQLSILTNHVVHSAKSTIKLQM